MLTIIINNSQTEPEVLRFKSIQQACAFFEIAETDAFGSFVNLLQYHVADKNLPWVYTLDYVAPSEPEEEFIA